MQCYHRLGNFDVKIILFEVSKYCRSGACQFRMTEQRLLLCLNFVLLAACLAGGLGKLTHTLSAPLQMKSKCMAGPEGMKQPRAFLWGVAKSMMHGSINIPAFA